MGLALLVWGGGVRLWGVSIRGRWPAELLAVKPPSPEEHLPRLCWRRRQRRLQRQTLTMTMQLTLTASVTTTIPMVVKVEGSGRISANTCREKEVGRMVAAAMVRTAAKPQEVAAKAPVANWQSPRRRSAQTSAPSLTTRVAALTDAAVAARRVALRLGAGH